MSALKIAFEPPESRPGGPATSARPIDFSHLDHQTMGDKDLECEVLRLFAREARNCVDRLAHDPVSSRHEIAHKLKGSARGVGAFPVASAAEAVEAQPADDGKLAVLLKAVAEVENFICGLSR